MDEALAAGDVTLFIGKLGRAVLGGELADLRAEGDLGAAVADQLADFARHQLGELFLAVLQLLADGADDLGAVLGGARLPVVERLVARGNGVVHLGVGHVVVGGDLFPVHGVDGLNLVAHGKSPVVGFVLPTHRGRRAFHPKGVT